MRLVYYLTFGVMCLLLGKEAAFAQARYQPRVIEPRWFTFRLSEVSAGFYADGHWQRSSYENSDITVDYYRWFAGPSLGLKADGSIYHPNLATYRIDSEGAFGYASDRYSGSGTSVSSREEFEYLGRFSGSMDFLSTKPYRGGVFANYDHTYRENDFFSTIIVDSWRYGGRVSWEHEPWLWTAYYGHRNEDSSSPYPFLQTVTRTNLVNGTNVVTVSTNSVRRDQVIQTLDDTVNTSLKHRRSRGESALTYNFNRYRREEFGRLGEGDDHSFTVSDSERFGEREQHRLNANATYAMRESSFEDSEEFLMYGSFSAEHRPNLSSFYDVNYDNYTTGDFESDSLTGQAQLTHQLFESLTTALQLRGSSFESTAGSAEGFTHRIGGGIANTYVKKTSEQSRLRVSHSIFIDHTEERGIGTVLNERHSILPGGENGAPPFGFFLNLPNVTPGSIIITDDQDSFPPFLEGFDYRVVRLGTRTIIEWLRPPGPGTPTVVLVDYEAQPRPEGEYQTFTDNAEVRFELWQNLWGLFARMSLSDNNAPAEMRVQEFLTYTFGTDFNYKGVYAGGEYQVYDGTDSDYRIFRLFQSYGWKLGDGSSLSVDLSEMWINYETAGRDEQDYRAMLRYHNSVTRRLSLNCDAGIAYRTGSDIEQLLSTVRPSIRYVVGRTTIDAGYDFEHELFLNQEERLRNMLYIRVKRVF